MPKILGMKNQAQGANPTSERGDTRARVERMDASGMTVREIALALNISTQAVYKHKAALAADRERAPA